MNQFFAWDGQGVEASASVLSMNIQSWFSLKLTRWISLQSKGLSRAFSSTTVQKHQFFGAHSAFFIVQFSHLYMAAGNTINLTIWIFAGKVMALLLNMLSRFVTTFLPISKHLLISWLQSPVILDSKKIKSHCFHCFPTYMPWSDGTECHNLSFLNAVLSQLFHSLFQLYQEAL